MIIVRKEAHNGSHQDKDGHGQENISIIEEEIRNHPHGHQGNDRNSSNQSIQTINQINGIGDSSNPQHC